MDNISAILEWYVGCDICAETLYNINKDLNPYGMYAYFDGDVVVAKLMPRKAPAKPVTTRRVVTYDQAVYSNANTLRSYITNDVGSDLVDTSSP